MMRRAAAWCVALAGASAGASESCDLRNSAYTRGAWVPSDAALAPTADERNTYVWNEFNRSCAARTFAWVWEARRCEIDAFNRHAFLDALRNKHVMLVGDSITEKSFESLRLMLGDAAEIPDVFLDADFYGQHQRNMPHQNADKPSKCFERHLPLPERWVTATETWLCCKRNCQTRACCRTVRQFYAPATNTTFSLHASETPVDVAGSGRADDPAPGVARDCLLSLRVAPRPDPPGLTGAAAACRAAPWTHHLPFVDVLVLNVGHHYHNSDPKFARYDAMVSEVLRVIDADLGGRFVFRATNAGVAPPGIGCAPYLCGAPTAEPPPTPPAADVYQWRDAVRHDAAWPAALAAAPPALRAKSLYLNITHSTALRPDAMASDCLHPNHPISVHWFTLLSHHAIRHWADG